MAILSILLTAIIIIVSILIVLIVLVQRPKQEGLGAAFGGGAFDSALGAHTTDVLQKITTYFAIFFFVSAIGLSMINARKFREAAVNNPLENLDKREMPTTPDLPNGLDGALSPLVPLLNDADKGKTEVPTPVEAPKADAPKADAPKAEAPKADAPKAEAPKADAPKAEAPKAAAPKSDAPKAEAPKAAAPKGDAPKAEAPKADAPKAEAPKAAAPASTPAEGASKGGQ